MGIKMAQSGRQRGYVLVTVLILAMVASMVAFVSIRENQLQERMSGNQQKMINARLAAEKGIAAALDYVKAQLANGTDIATIANNGGIAALRGNPDVYRLSDVFYSSTDKRLTLLSTGHDVGNDATAQLKARFELRASGSAIAKGVIGCENLEVTGGGFIDSYDSNKGGYNVNSNRASNASVAIVNGNGIEIIGEPTKIPVGLSVINGDLTTYNGYVHSKGSGSTVSGNVTANGVVILNGNTNVGGNVTAKTDVTLNGNNNVGGNIHSGGGFIADSGSSVQGGVSANSVRLNGNTVVNGNVVATGELVTNGNSTIKGNASAASADLKGTINGSLSVDGNSIATDNGNGKVLGGVNYNATDRSKNPQPSIPEPGVLAEYCKARADNTWLKQQLGTLPAGNNGELTNSSFTNMASANNKTYSKLDLKGDNADNKQVIEVTQNTTLYVTGGVTMANLIVKVSHGKSLTIKQVTNGINAVVDMNDVAILSSDGAPLGTSNNGGVPPVSIYTDTGDQVNIRAENHEGVNTPMFSAVYAPLANIGIKAGAGEFSGSLLGKSIQIQNPLGFHYDEGLSNAAGGGGAATLNLLSVLDAYPN